MSNSKNIMQEGGWCILMGKKYDSYGVREEEIIYLAQPGKKVICALGNVERTSVSIEDKLNDISELTFEIDKYYNGVPVQEYDWVDQYMLLYVDGIWFKIKEQPVENTDGSRTYKKVTAMSLETELQQFMLVGFKVNQGTVDSIEKIYQDEHELDSFQQVRFYNKDIPELSLVDAILAYANVPDWKIGYVDDVTIGTEADLNGEYKTLPYEVAGFEVESQDVYSFLTQDVSKTFSCMFQFDTENKLINVYRVDAVGYDTNIILGFRNLQNSLEVSCDTELCTAFEVRGDEDMTIDNVNFRTSRIEDISYFLDTKYMPQELIDKYNAWVEYRESRRPEYIELSGEYNTFLNTISEIMYRVPADGVENDWTTYEEDDLKLALDNYNAMVTQLEHLYVDDHGNFDLEALKASTDWELYKQIVDYIIPSIKAALQKQGVDTSTNGTGNLFKNVNPVITLNWQTITEDVLTPIDIEDAPCEGITRGIQVQSNGGLYQAVSGLVIGEQYTISAYVRGSGTAKIEIALYNQDKVTIKGFPVSDKWIRIDASFTATAKYYKCYYTFGEGVCTICGMQLERGTLHDFGYFAGLGNDNDSLSAWETNWALYGTVELKNKLDSYNNAVESLEESGFDSPYYEGSSYSWEYHTKMYQKYNDYLSLIDDCQKAYDERCAELKVQEDKRDELAKKRQKIADDVQKENFGSVQEAYLGFTDEELDLLRTFINHRNYVNEHIIATDLDTEKEKVSQQYDLYLKAKERLYIESHPQYIYSDTVDNLYALPEFKEYHEDLKVGNFLWIEDSEEHFVKLRVVTIKYNPCTWDNDITIEFSNMVRGIYGTNDVASIIQSAIESTRNQIIGMTNNRDITSYTITSEFIRQLLKNPIMGNAISNGGSNAVASMTGQIDFLVSKAIKTEKITADVVDAVTGNFQKIFTTYIEGDLASFSKTVTDFLMAGQIITDDVKSATGTFTNYLTGVKILGDLIEANTIIADKLVLRGSNESVVYQLNQLGELTTEMVENIEQYQFDAGKTIITDSITSREINVNDLWVTGIANMLNANIGTALINDLTALTSHLGTWYFHESIIEGTYDSMLIGGYLQSKNYAENNGVVTAGCKIDLNNFSIDSPNFKISPSGNVEMTGTLAVGSKVSMGSVYDENGTPLEDVLNTIGTSINLHSKDGQVFTESASVITPSSITVNAVCDGDVTVAKWLIDDVENTEYVAADKMSITIPSSYMASKKQIVVKAQNADGTVYDYITLCRLTDGANGINGIDGENGFFYIAYSANSNGNPMTTTPQADTKYMGVYSGVEGETITDYTKFKWTLIRGNDGINGIAGKDGKTYYTWIKYATSPNPTSMSDTPDGMDYIGIAYNKETSEGSNNPNDYAWSLLRGEQGIQGIPGEDGEQLYTWIKYADTPTTGMSDAPENKDYMGIAYNKTTVTESNNYSDYQWIYIRGEQGIPGTDGTDGKSSYLHIKYSNDGGKTFTSANGETLGTWVGTYVDQNSTDSSNVSDYKWKKFVGEDGESGIGYTVVLSNENHGFVADGDGIVQAEQIQIKVSAWKNISAIATTVTIPELPTGMTATVSNNGTTNTYVTINVNSSLTGTKGTVGFSITADGVNFTKIFSWSINRGGKDGKPGRVYGVDSSSTSAVYNIRNGECTPSSVSFNAYYSDGDSKEKLTLDCYMQISYTSTGSTWIKYGDRLHCTNGTTAFNFLSTSHLDGLPVNTETGIITAVKCEIFATETSDTAYASKEITIVPSMNELAVLGFVEENNTIWIDGSKLYAGSVSTSVLAAEVIKSVGCEYSSSSVYATKGTYFDLATGALASQNFAITEDGEVYVKGHIIADSLTLGSGVTIDADDVYGLDNKVSYYVDESGAIIKGKTYSGSEYNSQDGTKSRSFSVSSSGLLEANNAIIYGTIYASAGSFTGTVDAKSMTAKEKYKLYYDSNTNCADVIWSEGLWTGTSNMFVCMGIKDSAYLKFDKYNHASFVGRLMFGSDATTSSSYISLSETNGLNMHQSNFQFTRRSGVDFTSLEGCTDSDFTIYGYRVALKGHTHSGYATTSQLSNYATTSYVSSNYASSSHGHFKLSLGGNGIDLVYAGTQNNGGGSYTFAPYASAGNIDLGCNSTGNSSWYNIYTRKGVTNKSDRNDKENFATIDERYEKMFMDLSPSLYMLKGTNGHIPDRVHCGFIAQEVNEAAEKNGLSAETFAAICRDDLDEPTEDGRTETWGLRYHEFHGLEVHMIQKALREIENLKADNIKLKADNIELKDEIDSLKERMSVLEGN